MNGRNLLHLVALMLLALGTMAANCGPKPTITITSPAHGAFSGAANITIAGTINTQIATSEVQVNGSLATLNPDKTWSITLPLDGAAIVNPFLAKLVRTTDGRELDRERIVVHAGSSIADGNLTPQGVALRLNDSGLDQVEPLIESGVSFDIAGLLPVGLQVINDFCAIDGGFLGCLGSVDVFIANPPASSTGFSFDANSQTNAVDGFIDIFNVEVNIDINGSGLAPSCDYRITSSLVELDGLYGLQPDSVDPSNIDVNLLGSISSNLANFNATPTSGICDFPLIGNLIDLIIQGSIEPAVQTGLENFLNDPDGGGPADSPIADAFEVALADISITGPIGTALQVQLESPLFDVFEDTVGITLDSDIRVQSSIGGGPGQCTPPAGAPDLAASFHVSEAFPAFGATTPVGGLPYDLGLCISTSGFNQLLKAQTECGLLLTEITEFDFGGGLVPITAGTLALLVPEFSSFPPGLELVIRLTPSLSALLTGNAGPGGEIGEIRIGQYIIEVVGQDSLGRDVIYLRGAIDFRAGLDFVFDDVVGALVFSIGSVTPADITVSLLNNFVQTNEAVLQVVLPQILALVLPDLAAGLG
ncbi:MAG: hypothetical protein QNK03_16465, partial [Myxococcota bacterium]|nr:hypothetical protein [Myxococcota bacterium]